MIEILEPLFIPNYGAYDAGTHVELNDELEKQLIASGKAKPSKRKTEKTVTVEVAPKGESASVPDD